MNEEDRRLILEFCGFKVSSFKDLVWGCDIPYHSTPDGGTDIGYPVLDLNFYFKYAVPKLKRIRIIWRKEDIDYIVTLDGENGWQVTEASYTPALAFGKALLQLIKAKNG